MGAASLHCAEAIRQSGLERQVIFNKGAVMILPSGINKAKGLETVLTDMNLFMHNVVAIGDAENDNAMLAAAECAVAVANALEAVKKQADWITDADHGQGVMQLIDRLLDNDLQDFDGHLKRHYLELGKRFDGSVFAISPYNSSILLAGSSGGGKTTFTVTFVEALLNKKYQFCLIDPEGDYSELGGAMVVGTDTQAPVIEEIDAVLKNPAGNIVVCTLAIPLPDRPAFFNTLLSKITHRRKTLGHPHWLICDEAHHLMPVQTEPSFFNIPADFNNFLLITPLAGEINKAALEHVNMVIATGQQPRLVIEEFAKIRQIALAGATISALDKSQGWIWRITQAGESPFPIQFFAPQHLTKRHKKKYATGDMYDNSFIFKGPESKLNLKANNLIMFMHMAQGVDDDTWMYHLKRNDYSNWFRNSVHDEDLADLTEKIQVTSNDPQETKKAIFQLINERYTAPAGNGIKGKVPAV